MSIYDDYVKWAKAGGSAYNSPVARAAQAGTVLGTGGAGKADEAGAPGQSPLEWGMDIISRPRYAVLGGLTQAIRKVGKSEAGDAIGSVLGGVRDGFFSTEQKDKYNGVDVIDELGTRIAEDNGDTYVAPTLSSEVGKTGDEAWRNVAAVGRGLGGFALDVGADPLTYGTMGVGTAVKGVGKLIAGQTAKAGVKASEAAAGAAGAASKGTKAAEEAPFSPTAAPKQAPGVPTQSTSFGAANVASPTPASVLAPQPAASTFARVSNPKATSTSLPKVSETIKASSSGVVSALLKTSKALDEAAASAKPAAVSAKAAASTPKASAAGNMGTFAREFFKESDDVVTQLPVARGVGAANVFPSTIIKNLSSGNLQAQQTYWKRLVAAAKDPKTSTPQLREFLTAASRWSADAKAAREAGATTAPAAKQASAVEAIVESGARSQLLPELLRQKGKPTALGKEIKATLGEQLFRKLSSTRTPSAEREKIFEELSTLANDADSVSPTTFDGMHENVRHFVEDTMQLRREDFDLAVRQKMFDRDIAAQKPRLTNPKTARAVDPNAMKAASAFTGHSAKVLLNDSVAQARKIIGEAFDPSKGKHVGNTYFYDDGTQRVAIINGRIDVHPMMDAVNGARNEIDKALPPTLGKNGKPAVFVDGKAAAAATAKTKARRHGAVAADGTKIESLPERIEAWEKTFNEAGVPIGVHVGEDFVMLNPSAVYKAAEDIIRAARQSGDASLAKVLDDSANIVLFNPGTAAPETLFWSANAHHLLGASDAEVLAILRTTKSKYNGTPIGRNPLATNSAGARYRTTQLTAEELSNRTLEYIKRLAPAASQRSQGIVREYAEKSMTDAGAIAGIVGDDLAAAAARGDGAVMSELAGIEKKLAELAQEFGASPHAMGMAADALSRNLPAWAVKRAKDVQSTQASFVNAARMGKTADEIRAMGAASEVRHTPIDAQAAADDFDLFVEAAKGADEGSELYGLGTDTHSVLYNEARYNSYWSRMLHPLRSRFDARYGTVVDGVDVSKQTRYAAGSPAQDIREMSNYIVGWGKQYNTVRLAESSETVASAAWKLLQRGADDAAAAVEPTVAKALEELRPIAARMFDVDKVGMGGDLYWRVGTKNIRYLERSMEVVGMKRKYGDVFSDALMKGDGSVTEWWRGIDIEDPVEFMMQYNSAVHAALGERVSMQLMVKELKRTGLLSTTAKPGFAKPRLEGNSFFYAGLEDSGAFIDKRVLEAMSEVDRAMYAARSFGESSPISTVLDPALAAWKVAMTIYRPGHHIRNVTSNGMLAYIAEGPRNLAKSGVTAAQIMARREGKDIAAMGELERLLTGEASKLKSGGDTVVQTSKIKGGKSLAITDGMLHDAAASRGVFRTFRQSEDIIEGKGRVQRASDIITGKGTKVEHVVGGLSEGLDHHGYLQQFVQIVLNNAKYVGTKYKSLDDLYDYAVQRSYKFHPDSAALAPFESKYMRRLMPFYTWFRGTLPGVMETAMLHPGRVMIAPKASFNIAQTYGIDAESLANPWPEDADIPEYMQESAFGANAIFGGQMFALNPGFAHQDLARDFFGRGPEEGGNFATATLSNAGRMMWDMMTPFIKAPVELAAGKKLSTGTTIQQSGDYIDDQIPLVNYLSKTSGISFAGTAMNPGAALEQGRPIERSNVQSGYQPSIFDEGIGSHQHQGVLNFLLGQGAQQVDTTAGKAEKKTLADERKAAREEAGLYAAPYKGGFSNSSSGGSSKSTETTKPGAPISFNGVNPTAPERAALDPTAADALAQLLEERTGKKLTPSQLLSAIKAQQEDALRRQNAMYGSDYNQQLLTQLQAANPDLTVSELIQLAKQFSSPYK